MNGSISDARCPLFVPLPDVSKQDTLGNRVVDDVLYLFREVEIENLADRLVTFWLDTGGVHAMNDVGGNHCTSCLIRSYCIQARMVTDALKFTSIEQ